MHNRQAITPRRLWHAVKDYDLWPSISFTILALKNKLICSPVYALGLICFIPQAPPSVYLTQILRSIGFSTVSPASGPKPAVSNALIVQYQSAHHSLQRLPHHHSSQHHLGQRKAESTRLDWHLPTHLDTPLYHRPRLLAWPHQGEMGDVCPGHHVTLVPILSCYQRWLGQQEFE